MSVLWLRDSFGDAISPYINATFSQTLQISYHRTNKKQVFKALASREKPDLVLYLVVERALFEKAFYTFGESG